MPTSLISIPLKPGQTDAARAFAQECVGSRFADFDASERRINILVENWYLQRMGGAEFFTIYVEGPDINASMGAFAASQDPFDSWFKAQVRELTGIDISAGPPPPDAIAETLAEYKVAVTVPPQR